MSSGHDSYTSPLAARNASEEMLRLWSPRHKFNTWRRIWLAVAEAQCELGLPVAASQVDELRNIVARGITDDELRAAEKYERELRHDVMAHVHAFGDSCPGAKGVIHLGMTSQDVVCNADLMIMRDAIRLITVKIMRAVHALSTQAKAHIATPTLAFTHYQAAQPVTVGRRFAEWAYELNLTAERLVAINERFRFKGFRGATGTQASYLALCEDDHEKVDELEAAIVRKLLGEVAPSDHDDQLAAEIAASVGFTGESAAFLAAAMKHGSSSPGYLMNNTHALVTQNYPRVHDAFVLSDLAAASAVLHKIATDIRLLSNRKEIDEPFESKQIGSSAMPYKRNPMRSERICGLARFVMNLVGNTFDTAATQWLERTLDDSSNRRLSLPEAFLALDGALDLMHNVASGLIVHEAMVRRNLMAELPFMATENILMECVKLGGDRQQYHELIRQHAQAAGMRVKQEGLDNDLLDRLRNDPNFHGKTRGGPLTGDLNWDGLLDPMRYVGRSIEQTNRFLTTIADPIRATYGEDITNLGQGTVRV